MRDNNAAFAVAMRVRVLFSGASMCGPARVADAELPLHGLLRKKLFEIPQLARCAPNLKRSIFNNSDTGRIVAAVFQ